VIIGGLGTIEGPILGAIIFWVLNRFFSDYGTWYLVRLGLMAIIITILFKRGLWGYIQATFGIRLFPVQRRLEPSTNSDVTKHIAKPQAIKDIP
jgi:branched-chain amino acid transport system permease protein